MATFDELMAAAGRAHAAGDTAGAQTLVDAARNGRKVQAGQAGAQSVSPDNPQFSPVDVPTTIEGTPGSPPRVDSFGPTIRAATEAPIAATKHFAKQTIAPDRTIPQRAGDAAMTALSATGATYALGAGLAGELLGGSPTGEKKLARDLMMMGEVAVPELAGVSSVTAAAGSASRRASRQAAKTPKAVTQAQRTARAADDLGITPSLGTGGKGRAMTAATLEKVPGSGPIIAKDAVRFVDEVEKAFDDIVPRVGKAQGANAAGDALKTGADKFVTAFKGKSKQLYEEVGKRIPEGTKINAPDTVQSIKAALEPFKGNPEIASQLGLNKWAGMAADMENGMTWKAASDLRSSIGESIGKINGPLANMDQGKLKTAYATLTNDLERAAMQAGPDAEKAWKRASNYYARGSKRIQDALDKTVKADSPERAFEAFEAMTKEGRASANADRLYKMKASMPKQEWDVVAGSVVDRLGNVAAGQRAADGAGFSPSSFLTNWNKMSDEAKSILLPGDVRNQLNKLAEVAEGAKAANVERNFSNTGTIVTGAGVGAGLVTAPMTTISFLGGSALSSKALTSRRMLKALNAHTRGDSRQLNALAKSTDPLAVEARTVLRITAADAAQGSPAANTQAQPQQLAR